MQSSGKKVGGGGGEPLFKCVTHKLDNTCQNLMVNNFKNPQGKKVHNITKMSEIFIVYLLAVVKKK